MIIALGWLVCGIASAAIGARKGIGVTAFFVGILLGPLGIILAIADKGNRVECPFCRELMHRDATICPHCHRESPPVEEQPPKLNSGRLVGQIVAVAILIAVIIAIWPR